MIPNMIKRLAKGLYQALTPPLRTLAKPAGLVCSILAKPFVAFATRMSNPETQGDFNLPRELRIPFFFAATLTSLAVAAYYGFYWVENIAKPEQTALTVIASGAKMAPGFIAIILLAGLSISPLAYILIWGVGMLGAFLRKMDQSETIEDLRTKLEEANTQLEQAKTQSEEDKEILRNQLRRSGQEPEA